MIETPRLTLLPLTLEQLSLHVADRYRLEQTLGLQRGHREVTEPLLSIITHFTVPRLKDPANDPLYHTVWIAIDRDRRQIVADAKFKGEPDETGTVEIGYGTYPAFQRLGYMTEMVGGLVRWAGEQLGVRRVVADTDAENVASQKVLEKNGFRLFDRVENILWWEYIFDKSDGPAASLMFDEHGYLTPYAPITVSDQTVQSYFATNAHRLLIWHQLVDFCGLVREAFVPVVKLWINGSFISQKQEPDDADIVAYVDYEYRLKNYTNLINLSGQFTKLHVIWIGLWPMPNSLQESVNELEEFNWLTWFNTDRNDRSKGFVEVNW